PQAPCQAEPALAAMRPEHANCREKTADYRCAGPWRRLARGASKWRHPSAICGAPRRRNKDVTSALTLLRTETARRAGAPIRLLSASVAVRPSQRADFIYNSLSVAAPAAAFVVYGGRGARWLRRAA